MSERVEYRVVWWSEQFGRWFPHAQPTENPEIAEAWLNQARHRGAGRTPATIQTRTVTAWTSAPVVARPAPQTEGERDR